MKTSNPIMTIGGLPAARWINRSVRVKVGAGDFNSCKVLNLDLDRGDVVVLMRDANGARSVRVRPEDCHPWWAQNPDLKLEAEVAGALFNGEVSVGRALVKAAEVSLFNFDPPPVPFKPEPMLSIPVAVEEAEPAAIKETEPVVKQVAAKEPARSKLRSIEVPVTLSVEWAFDYEEYRRLTALRAVKEERIEQLRTELVDDELLADMHLEQLQAAGVILNWESPAGSAPQSAEVPRPHAPSENSILRAVATTHRTAMRDKLLAWLAKSPPEINYKQIFECLNLRDDQFRRVVIRDVLEEEGYVPAPKIGKAGILKFVKK